MMHLKIDWIYSKILQKWFLSDGQLYKTDKSHLWEIRRVGKAVDLYHKGELFCRGFGHRSLQKYVKEIEEDRQQLQFSF